MGAPLTKLSELRDLLPPIHCIRVDGTRGMWAALLIVFFSRHARSLIKALARVRGNGLLYATLYIPAVVPRPVEMPSMSGLTWAAVNESKRCSKSFVFLLIDVNSLRREMYEEMIDEAVPCQHNDRLLLPDRNETGRSNTGKRRVTSDDEDNDDDEMFHCDISNDGRDNESEWWGMVSRWIGPSCVYEADRPVLKIHNADMRNRLPRSRYVNYSLLATSFYLSIFLLFAAIGSLRVLQRVKSHTFSSSVCWKLFRIPKLLLWTEKDQRFGQEHI